MDEDENLGWSTVNLDEEKQQQDVSTLYPTPQASSARVPLPCWAIFLEPGPHLTQALPL